MCSDRAAASCWPCPGMHRPGSRKPLRRPCRETGFGDGRLWSRSKGSHPCIARFARAGRAERGQLVSPAWSKTRACAIACSGWTRSPTIVGPAGNDGSGSSPTPASISVHVSEQSVPASQWASPLLRVRDPCRPSEWSSGVGGWMGSISECGPPCLRVGPSALASSTSCVAN